MLYKIAHLGDIDQFDTIIDVRSPAEFAEDHIPGAINCPVLTNEERITVGTLYKQASPFEAKRLGAALVSKNIGLHIETLFQDKPKSWKPLVYCWRGGQRSGAMSIVLAQVGWAAHQLAGGYKSYRSNVLSQLESLPLQFDFKVVCGPTGSGKSRLLQAMQKAGHQVLDLEGLAHHRGSVLGKLPDAPQPSQKMFDSKLLQALAALDPSRPVYIESESKKIGFVSLPATLFERMHQSPCLIVDVPLEERVRFLLEDYAFYLQEPSLLIKQLNYLRAFYAKETLQRWQRLIEDQCFSELVYELLLTHYDPLYKRSINHHYNRIQHADHMYIESLEEDTLDRVIKYLK